MLSKNRGEIKDIKKDQGVVIMTVTTLEIIAFALFVATISLLISLLVSPLVLIPIFVLVFNIILFLMIIDNY